jgi:ubiquinone/menaquinone biosynthesis C-methylase UbiE
LHHDTYSKIYRKKRAAGLPGWHEPEFYPARVGRALAFLARLGAQAGDKVLVLGCGAGNTAIDLARKGFEVSGVDVAWDAIAWARDSAASAGVAVEFRVGDVTDLSFAPGGRFDFALDDYCLQHILGASRPACFAGIRRILRRGGGFHVGADLMVDDVIAVSETCYFEPTTQCLYRDFEPFSYLTREGELTRELECAGFLVVRTEHHSRSSAYQPYVAGRDWIDAVNPG